MAPIALETEDHSRDAAFHKAMHGKSADSKGFRSMLNKDHDAHKAASDEYFKHWDNKSAGTETIEIRDVSADRSGIHLNFLSLQTNRHGKQSMPLLPGTITTLPPISTSTAGEVLSTSADSLTVRASTRPLLDTNTILRTLWVFDEA